MSVQHLTGPQLVQHLALVGTGPPHTAAELMTELDHRCGAGAMERLAQHATRLRADPFEILTAAFTEPAQVIAIARGQTAAADTEDPGPAPEYLPEALAHVAGVTRRATGDDRPRLNTLTAAVMAEALITAG
ncbi:MAG: hypothetical protein L0I76_17710, partial [Pseudonocardia sp.]|nr:hypothetical protein [Pseudonocardia sp.]